MREDRSVIIIIVSPATAYKGTHHAPVHSNKPCRVDRAFPTRRGPGRPTSGSGAITAERSDVEREGHIS